MNYDAAIQSRQWHSDLGLLLMRTRTGNQLRQRAQKAVNSLVRPPPKKANISRFEIEVAEEDDFARLISFCVAFVFSRSYIHASHPLSSWPGSAASPFRNSLLIRQTPRFSEDTLRCTARPPHPFPALPHPRSSVPPSWPLTHARNLHIGVVSYRLPVFGRGLHSSP